MHYRTFGRTGWQVSDVGYGMWGMGGWTESDDAESMAALHRSVELGCNFFDTAWGYGKGHSEGLLGQLVRAYPAKKLYTATKIPPKNFKWPSRRGFTLDECFPPDHIRQYVEWSLKNLGLSSVDLIQFHVWEDDWAQDERWQKAMLDLKSEGLINAVGVSVNRWEPDNVIRTLKTGMIDAVQVIYNIFEQAPEDELYPVCQELNIGVIARVPFDEGGLTGAIRPDSVFPATDFRSWFFRGDRKREVYERVEKLKGLLDDEATSLPELALRYTLSHDAVSTVIPGMRSTKHVTANISCSDGRRLSDELLTKLKAFAWDRTGDW